MMSAYVEIIFDNSDERFPTGRKELILRRTVGTKKDEYTLDRKNATKADVMNLLESAGFSRSNPYYIVPQGRVTTITNMKDSERLNLLKEVAGTQVYESRRAESLKIMNDTNNKRSKIDESLGYINERLAELEEEKNELRDYQEKDRERRCLEYTIYSREQAEIAAALEAIENQRQTGVEDTDSNRNHFIQGENDIAEIETEISEHKQQIELLKLEKAQLDDDRRDASKTLAQAELQLKSLEEGQSANEEARSRRETNLGSVHMEIEARENELNTLLPEFNSRKEEENAVRAELTDLETAQQRLYAKQGRNSRFRNKGERDRWLQSEINDTNNSLSTVKAVRMQTEEEIGKVENDISLFELEIDRLGKQLDGRGDAMHAIEDEIQNAKEERDRLMDQRKYVFHNCCCYLKNPLTL